MPDVQKHFVFLISVRGVNLPDSKRFFRSGLGEVVYLIQSSGLNGAEYYVS